MKCLSNIIMRLILVASERQTLSKLKKFLKKLKFESSSRTSRLEFDESDARVVEREGNNLETLLQLSIISFSKLSNH